MKKFVALLLAVLMVASLCACGQKDTQTGSDIKTVTAGKLTMSTNAQFPPYESVADDGKGYEGTGFEGIDIEIAYALAQKLGLELVVDDMDFDSALSAVQTGKSDIVAAGVTVTPERQNTKTQPINITTDSAAVIGLLKIFLFTVTTSFPASF